MNTPNYTTKDIYLASFLVLKNHTMIGIKKHDNKCTFEFSQNAELTELIDVFYNRKALVEPMEYSMSMKQIKSKMYNL
jgi:hypothetical protein